MKKLILFAISIVISGLIYCQNLPLPVNIQKALDNHTRSMDGKPGPDYWQNHSDYKIDAEIDTATNVLKGTESIVYYNESPDTLNDLVLRLYQNIFKKGAARQWNIPEGDLTDGVKISTLKIGGKEYDPEKDFPKRVTTNFAVDLKEPLLPHSQTTVEVGWEVRIPSIRGIRMGKYAKGHYFIAYWYPQIAVYDDIDGWDRVEYTGIVEFYNDFNNYDVSLTVPGNYLVRSTGEVQNISEIVQPQINKRYQEAKNSDSVIRIVTQEDYKMNRLFKPDKSHTWKIKAEHVPDFSFAMSDHSDWDGTSLIVDKTTGRRVFTDALYPDGSANWEQAADVARKAVDYLSNELPGFPFPYPHITSFCAGPNGGGMETPMMTNDGAPKKFDSFAGLIFHEISHSYFPFFMGTNERKYAFMDEGWAACLTSMFLDSKYPGSNDMQRECEGYNQFAGQEADLPLMALSYQHNNYMSYRTAAYNQPAMAYNILRLTLGDDLFKKGLKEYIARWNGKHPIPYDFFNTFNEATGQNLDWFWQPWFFETGYPDLAIEKIENNIVTIKKKGNYPVPVLITYKTANGSTGEVDRPASVWKEGKNEIEIPLPPKTDVVQITLGNSTIPDVNKKDNEWKKAD